ncbi:MAG: matrixin family metalloprotease [Alphaproteobacteria bacterium]|nr:matrixin family metalloprotease [Alphaproteobacteria bacterium]
MPYRTGNNQLDTLLSSSKPHWNGNGSFQEAAAVTFSFVQSKVTYNATPGIGGSEDLITFSPFSAAQEQAARAMLKAWANVANITFKEVSDTASVHGNIRLMNTADIDAFGFAGSAFFPNIPANGNKETNPESGDVSINPLDFSNFDFSEHGFGKNLLLHEIGHALGLTHTNEVDSLGSVPLSQKTDRFSVMVTPANGGVPCLRVTASFRPGRCCSTSWRSSTSMAPTCRLRRATTLTRSAIRAWSTKPFGTRAGSTRYPWRRRPSARSSTSGPASSARCLIRPAITPRPRPTIWPSPSARRSRTRPAARPRTS